VLSLLTRKLWLIQFISSRHDRQAAGNKLWLFQFLYLLHEVTFDLFLQKAVEFEEDKKNGKFVSNMGRLPILVIDGVEIGQSHAIFRYIASRNA
jgi:hypothetical protein